MVRLEGGKEDGEEDDADEEGDGKREKANASPFMIALIYTRIPPTSSVRDKSILKLQRYLQRCHLKLRISTGTLGYSCTLPHIGIESLHNTAQLKLTRHIFLFLMVAPE